MCSFFKTIHKQFTTEVCGNTFPVNVFTVWGGFLYLFVYVKCKTELSSLSILLKVVIVSIAIFR